MIHDLRPYPLMKDSGVPWLGQVPEHWGVNSLWQVSQLRSQRNPGDMALLSVFLDRGVIPYGEGGGQVHAPSLDLSNYQVVRRGDFVLNNQQAWRGSVGVSKFDGIISPAYIVLNLSERLLPAFANYLFRNPLMVGQFVTASKGVGDIQRQLYWPYLKNVRAIIPPPDEQAVIVRFLDHADRRIRKAIAAKQKLIRLLQEQKQVIIHQAVTRGLDPNVKLKPSGVGWLGDVPADWEVRRLKQVATVQTGITLGKDYRGEQVAEYPYLRVANVQAGKLDLTEVKTIQVTAREAARSRLERGDVLMTEGGDIDKLGRGCVWNAELEECLHQNHLFAVRPNIAELKPEFLVKVMSSSVGRRYFELTAKQTTNLASTNSTTLGNFPLALPPLPDQQLILQLIQEESEPLERAEQRIQQEIALLREYLIRLIAEVVTGKLDVREAALLLPEPEQDTVPEELDSGEGEVEDTEATEEDT